MLSALPANDPLLSNPFSVGFHGAFKFETAASPKPVTSSTGSDIAEQTHGKEKQGSEDSNRKRRRIISNRESTRRSCMRKQRHLQNLRNQLNLFRVQNRELKTRLQFLLNHYICVRTEFDWLRSERTLLCQKLSNLSQFMVFQQHQPLSSTWPCYNLTAE